jgi:hypothetical protein
VCKPDIEEALKTTSVTILILVFAASFHQHALQAARPLPDQSTKLIISPAMPIYVAIRRNMTILDVYSSYNIIQSRHATIELTLNNKIGALLSVSKPGGVIWCRDRALRLQNGRADIFLVARRQDCSVISARCVEERSPTLPFGSTLTIDLGGYTVS